MKHKKRVLIPIVIISGSIGILTINHVFSYFSFKADDVNISISGITTILGDNDYYLYWNNSSTPVGLNKSSSNDNEYMYTVNTTSTGTYTYKVVDKYNKEVYSQDSFELGLNGDFNLIFNKEDTTSSLTYDFTIKDTYKVIDEVKCTPSSSLMSLSNSYYITGSFCSWNRSDSYRMFVDSNFTDLGRYKNIYLKEGDSFKITNFSEYYGYSAIGGGNDSYFTNDSYDNMVVKTGKSGYYSFYLNSSYKIYIDKNTDQGMSWDDSITCVKDTSNSQYTSYTYTLDAIKYGSGNTYLNFYDSNKDKYIDPIQVKDIKTDRNALLSNKYIYLVPNTSYWEQANAWFMGLLTDKESTNNTALVEFNKCDSNTSYYKAEVSIDYDNIKLYRMNPSTNIDNQSVGDIVNSWNEKDVIDIATNYSYLVTGWGTSDIKTNVKPYDESRFTLFTVD